MSDSFVCWLCVTRRIQYSTESAIANPAYIRLALEIQVNALPPLLVSAVVSVPLQHHCWFCDQNECVKIGQMPALPENNSYTVEYDSLNSGTFLFKCHMCSRFTSIKRGTVFYALLKNNLHGKLVVHHRSSSYSYLGNFIFRWLLYRRLNSYTLGYCCYNGYYKARWENVIV